MNSVSKTPMISASSSWLHSSRVAGKPIVYGSLASYRTSFEAGWEGQGPAPLVRPRGREGSVLESAFGKRERRGGLARSLSRFSGLFALLSVLLSIFVVSVLIRSSLRPLPAALVSRTLVSGGLESSLEDFPFSFSESASTRELFLSRLEREERREFVSQVHFVSEIIRKHSRLSQGEKDLAFAIVTESRRAKYDPLLVAALIKAESTFRSNAKSSVGALGLMQLLPGTAQYISKRNQELEWKGVAKLSSEPHYNIRLGIAYLQYLDRYFKGNLRHVLIAYNWGPGALLDAIKGGRTPPRSTLAYAGKILHDREVWSKEFQSLKASYANMNLQYLQG